MGIEQLSKDELIKMLEDKKTTLSLLEEKKNAQPTQDFLTEEFVRALSQGRCRLCVGRHYDVADPNTPTKRRTVHEGQPYVVSSYTRFDNDGNPYQVAYGNEMACRTCRHVRKTLRDSGVQGVHDAGIE